MAYRFNNTHAAPINMVYALRLVLYMRALPCAIVKPSTFAYNTTRDFNHRDFSSAKLPTNLLKLRHEQFALKHLFFVY